MFEGIINFFKNMKKTQKEQMKSKDAAKERLHLVLMQDRANVSADFLDLMKQEIIEVIKKYIDVDENEIDVRLTNKGNGTTSAPALYANIPIMSIKNDVKNKVIKQSDDLLNQEEEKEEPIEYVAKEEKEKIEMVKPSETSNSEIPTPQKENLPQMGKQQVEATELEEALFQEEQMVEKANIVQEVETKEEDTLEEVQTKLEEISEIIEQNVKEDLEVTPVENEQESKIEKEASNPIEEHTHSAQPNYHTNQFKKKKKKKKRR